MLNIEIRNYLFKLISLYLLILLYLVILHVYGMVELPADMAEVDNINVDDSPSIFAPSISDHVPPVDLLIMGDHAYHQRPPTTSASRNVRILSSDETTSGRHSALSSRLDSTPTSVVADKDSFVRDVAAFFNHPELSDVVIIVGDREFFSHKFVLAKSSDVFRTMLYGSIWASNLTSSDSSNTTVQRLKLQESPDCELVFSKFLQFLYTAEIELSVDCVVGVLRLADKYNVTSLRNLCVSFMTTHSRSPKLRNAINWYPWAKLLNIESLLNQCRQTMAWHTEQLIKDSEDDWTGYDMELVRDILSNDEVIVRDEFSIFQAVSRWLLDPCRLCRLAENAIFLLPLVRFPQMLVTDLYRCERSDLYNNEASREIMHRLLSAAYRFRELYPKSAELGIQGEFASSAFYYPRDYLTLVVDMVQMHNTLRFGIQVDVKMYAGAVPQERKEADWKIRYSKHTNIWQVTFLCHDSALVFDSEARMQATVMIHDKNDSVIQVERLPAVPPLSADRMSEDSAVSNVDMQPGASSQARAFMTCTRGRLVSMSINVQNPECSQTMVVIIKPIP